MFRLGRWAIDAAVTLLALYALVYLPLGKQTGYQHLKDILTTREAKEAGAGLLDAANRIRHQLLGAPIETPGSPILPSLPGSDPAANGDADTDRRRSHPGHPELPDLAKLEPSADAGPDASLIE